MFEPPILTIKGAKLSFGENALFTDVDLYINRGDKISLVGRNGSGKSTLLKVIAKDIEPDAGEIFVQPGVRVSYMPQDPDFSDFATLRDVVLSGLPEAECSQEFKADMLIEQFDIRAKQKPEESSGGERKKAALAKALIGNPDILLLDEPTNHLDMPTIEKLEKIIADFRGAVILISHDRMFLSNTSKTTFWLDRGILRRNNKGFKFFEEWQEQVIDQEIIEQKYLNKKIEDMVDSMNDRNVRLVDMAEKFDWTRHTIKDKVHPNAEGADIMASVWLEELKKVLPKPKTEYKPEIAVYKVQPNGKEMKLHIFRNKKAKTDKPSATIVYFFGGGWANGTPLQFYRECDYYSSKGMTAITVDYRIRSIDGTSPFESIEDAKDAMRWIRSHASELNIDPERIAAG